MTTHRFEDEGEVWVAPADTPPPGRRGLGREHIDRHRVTPPPERIGLGDLVAEMFGAKIVEGRTAEESFVYRPNRAERRAVAKRRRRRG